MNPLTAFRTQLLNTSGFLRGGLLLAVVACRLSAATYYVDYSSGSDNNTGSSTSNPWKHCPGDSAATGTAAAVALVPGDSVIFKGGVSYIFTGSTGIALRWNGNSGSPIVYDGNSANAWGSGRAILTDNRGAAGITAFSAASLVSNLSFKNLEFADIGGAASLPADTGSEATARFGGGIAFASGVNGAVIDGCVFRNLGYAFNQKPMGATSISGTAILARDANGLTVSNSTFSRVANGIAFTGSSSLNNVKVTDSAFTDSIVWSLDIPAQFASSVSISGCTEGNVSQFERSAWQGYGESPAVSTRTVSSGNTVTFSATANALPTATFQWYKDGQTISGAIGSSYTIASAASTDIGAYTVAATNAAGTTLSHETVLEITAGRPGTPSNGAAPVFSTHPATQTVAANSTVTLTVAASGSPTILWYRNGATFAGWSGTTLTLPGFSANDVGTYHAVATNSSGSATSNAATISIGNSPTTPPPSTPDTAAPAFASHPQSQNVTANGTATLTVSVTGTPVPTVTWYRNGVTFNGWTGTTLSLPGFSANDVGAYTAIATNSAGSATSNPATVSVGDSPSTPPPSTPGSTAPAFATHPQSQSVANNGTATLSVSVTGTPAPTVTWYRNGVTFNGWTGTTLTLPGFSANDVGNYTAIATNSAGSATSNPAIVTVGNSTPTTPTAPTAAAPTITTQPTNQSVTANSTATFTVTVTGTPTPTVTWYRNGATFNGWTGTTLALPGVSSNDIGYYSAVATNASGSITSASASLSVGGASPGPAPSAPATPSTPALSTPTTPTTASAPAINSTPVFATHPSSQTVPANGTATLSVSVTGNPTPIVTWYRNGSTFNGWTGTTLSLPGFSANDVGTYTAVATNSVGSATSNIAFLAIGSNSATSTPAFTQQPVGITVGPFSVATFTVAVSGSPTPTVTWYRDGQTFNGWTGNTLTLAGISSNDAGVYKAIATNSAGSITSVGAVLTVDPSRSATGTEPLRAALASEKPASRLANLSVRSDAGTGDESLIVGFVVDGTASASLLMRGSGPALESFGVTGTLADPTLSLFSGTSLLAHNDDWSTSAATVAPASARAGAFALPAASRDAALVASLPAGAYTGQINGKDNASGAALIELYDLANDAAASLVNISVRTALKADGKAIVGFVVTGDSPKTLLIRAVGPSLSGFGVAGALADPQLELFSGSTLLERNDNWAGASELTGAFARVGAFALNESNSKDAVLLVSVPPGAYTAVVSGAAQSAGTALVEVYEVK